MSVSPSSGPKEGGTTVYIYGTNLPTVRSVRFHRFRYVDFTYDAENDRLVCVSPENPEEGDFPPLGAADVKITIAGPGGDSGNTGDLWSYT
ncbi:MAG: IPT/TIG domain-containing protein [Labilithrix sp.]|nr:IPT/TIG domain-containing protein [Labilithrix sp.]